MIQVSFPDNSTKSFEHGITPVQIARTISDGLARNVISVDYNGKILETNSEITNNGKIKFFTWNDQEGKKAFWHSSAHVLAQALEELYPNIKLTLGPPINNGFYYDVDFGKNNFSEKDFEKVEKRMIEICKGKHSFELKNISKKDALSHYKNQKKRIQG